MYQFRSLYGLKVGKGLLSQNDSYLVFEHIETAYKKQEELKHFMNVEVIDLYDYYKEYREIKEGFKSFYERVSKMIYDNDDKLTLVK